MPCSAAPATKPRALRVHLGLDLLAHGAAQQIGFAERIAGEILRDLHHLLLIDDDAVGLLQDRLEARGGDIRALLAVLARAIGRDIRHRPRTVERDQRDNILEAVRPHVDQRAPHALTFHLEHADHVAARQHVVGLGVVERQSSARSTSMPRCFSSFTATSSTVSVFRPRKSNFTSPAGSTHFMLNWVTGMSDFGSRYSGTSSLERPVADHDAGGVGRGVADQALELLRDVEGARRPPDPRRATPAASARSSIAAASVTGAAGFCGTSLVSLSTWP